MGSDIFKAAHLVVLSQQIEEGVEDHIDQWKGSVDRHPGKVTRRDRDCVAAGLRSQPRHHGRRDVDTVDAHATGRERQRDAAGTDRQLEDGARTGKGVQELDRGCLISPRRVVVDLGGFLTEAQNRLVAVHARS